MGNMDSWDVTLLVVAGYLAVVTLVRLMARRRNQVFEELRQKAEEEKHKQVQTELKTRRQRSA
jgi:type VI protein secretion system component VasK